MSTIYYDFKNGGFLSKTMPKFGNGDGNGQKWKIYCTYFFILTENANKFYIRIGNYSCWFTAHEKVYFRVGFQIIPLDQRCKIF